MKRVIDPMLRRIVQRGRLDVTWADGSSSRYGNGAELAASLLFRTAAAERRVALKPELAVGECYMDGEIEFPGDTLVSIHMP
jgi:cyclopropane-fatty-acyl-phospholipid synthase